MKSLEIIVEIEDGAVIQMKQGETFIMDDGKAITYEQMFKWLSEGSLKQHGFYPSKDHASESFSDSND